MSNIDMAFTTLAVIGVIGVIVVYFAISTLEGAH